MKLFTTVIIYQLNYRWDHIGHASSSAFSSDISYIYQQAVVTCIHHPLLPSLRKGYTNIFYWYLGHNFNDGSWCPNWDSANLISWQFWTLSLGTDYHGNCRWSTLLEFRTEVSIWVFIFKNIWVFGYSLLTELHFICYILIARKLLIYCFTFAPV